MSATNSLIQPIQGRRLIITSGWLKLRCRAYGKAVTLFIKNSLRSMMKLLEHVERVLNARSGDAATYRAIREAIDEVTDLMPHQRLAIFQALRRHGVIV